MTNQTYHEFLNSMWMNFHGDTCMVYNLTDAHLANIIHFLSGHNNSLNRHNNFKRLAKSRGLSDEFLNRAQIPYKNLNNKWEIWDKEQGFIEIGG